MTRDRFDLAMQHCGDLGIDVEWADLGDYVRGKCCVRSNVVTINRSLTFRQATATLGHELGHHKFGDLRSTPRNERRAWEYGAALLITPEEYRLAEGRVGCHPAALAIELDVTPKMIEAWRRWWATKGQHLPQFRALLELDA